MLGALLRIPFQTIVERIHKGLVERGFKDLRPAHYAIFQLNTQAGLRVTELAEMAQITKQSMSELVDYVEACGYVKRVPDRRDGRAKVVRLTERGVALDSAARDILAEVEAEWARRIGSERMGELKRTLVELIDVIEQERERGAATT